MKLTRRQLLAGLGGGSLAFGGIAFGQRPPRFTEYTYAAPDDDTDDARMRVAWYETYNGAVTENHAGTLATREDSLDPVDGPAYVTEATLVTDTAGPVVTVGNVLPGDTGTLVVGIEVVDEAGATPLDVYLRAAITDDSENGINEPELVAGDTTPDDGELDTVTTVEVWRDGSPFGSCDGVRQFGPGLEPAILARTTADAGFTGQIADEGILAFDCLPVGALRCVALKWTLPEATGNAAQGDTTAFAVELGGVACGSDSPFAIQTGGQQ
ncbi:MAG: hypothetical protein U5K28_09020 [Halobacteriales archaeon]|nr:hypothetical protein [Halobacteriales archaeon]